MVVVAVVGVGVVVGGRGSAGMAVVVVVAGVGIERAMRGDVLMAELCDGPNGTRTPLLKQKLIIYIVDC